MCNLRLKDHERLWSIEGRSPRLADSRFPARSAITAADSRRGYRSSNGLRAFVFSSRTTCV